MKKNCSYTHAAVQLGCNGATLAGDLALPEDAESIIILVRNSTGGSITDRSRFLTDVFNKAGFAVLSLNLLTEEEKDDSGPTGQLLQDVPVLTARLLSVIDWVAAQPVIGRLRMGLFGGEQSAAVVLNAGAKRTDTIAAVVACGGHTELTARELADIRSPALFIAGDDDYPVIASNRRAAAALLCPHRIELIPAGGRHFREKSSLKVAARRACHWFIQCLAIPAWLSTKTRNRRQHSVVRLHRAACLGHG